MRPYAAHPLRSDHGPTAASLESGRTRGRVALAATPVHDLDQYIGLAEKWLRSSAYLPRVQPIGLDGQLFLEQRDLRQGAALLGMVATDLQARVSAQKAAEVA